ncbi:hypothetical protein BsWGS_28477 [Bradybaena similaris]
MIPGSDHYWEVTLCALVDWIQFLSRVKQIQTSDAEVKALLISTCDLAFLATKTFDSSPLAADPVPRSPFLVVTEKARTEWNEFFSGVFPQCCQCLFLWPPQNPHRINLFGLWW